MSLAKCFFRSSRVISNYVLLTSALKCQPNLIFHWIDSSSPFLLSENYHLPYFLRRRPRSFLTVSTVSSVVISSHAHWHPSIKPTPLPRVIELRLNTSPCLLSWFEPVHFLHYPRVFFLKHVSNHVILLFKIFHWSPTFFSIISKFLNIYSRSP